MNTFIRRLYIVLATVPPHVLWYGFLAPDIVFTLWARATDPFYAVLREINIEFYNWVRDNGGKARDESVNETKRRVGIKMRTACVCGCQNKTKNSTFFYKFHEKKHTLVRAHLKCINNDARMRELKEDSRRSFKTQRSSSHITSLTCTTKNVRLLEHSHRAACNVWQMEEQISLQHSAYFLLSGQMQLLNSWMHWKFKVLMQRKRSIKHISPAAIMIFAWITGISEL